MPDKYFVKYLAGVAFYEESDGFLVVSDKALEFNARKFRFSIPIEHIVEVKTAETDDAAKGVGSFIAFGIIGAIATKSMSKNRDMRVFYKDDKGVLQKAEFRFLPRTVKEVYFMDEAAAKITDAKQKILSKLSKIDLEKSETVEKPKEKVVVEREIIRETIVKVRCRKCRGLFEETLDKCPHCGAPN